MNLRSQPSLLLGQHTLVGYLLALYLNKAINVRHILCEKMGRATEALDKIKVGNSCSRHITHKDKHSLSGGRTL